VRKFLVPLAVLVLGGIAAAQTLVSQGLFHYPHANATSFTSRYQATAPAQNEVEVLHKVENDAYTWIGINNPNATTGTAVAYQRIAQDQNTITQERWNFIVRREAAGVPDDTAAGLAYKSIPHFLPPGAGGIAAWQLTIITDTFTLPASANFYMGVEMQAVPTTNGGWPSDGQSNHASAYYVAVAAVNGNCRPSTPNHAWGIVHGSPNVVSQPSDRMMRQSVFTQAALLQVGSFDSGNTAFTPNGPNFGEAGVRPDINNVSARTTPGPRYDDLRLVITDTYSDFFALYLDVARGPGLGITGISGRYGLTGGLLVIGSGALNFGVGNVSISLGTGPNGTRTSLVGKKLHWQALCFSSSLNRNALTNVGTHIF
jgi:hypothetical protein